MCRGINIHGFMSAARK